MCCFPEGSLLRQILFDHLGLDALELALGQDGQQLPAEIQGLLDGAVGGVALGDVALLKFVGELGEKLVVIREGGLAQAKSWFMVPAWSSRVLPTPMPLSFRRLREGSTSTGGTMPLRYSSRLRMI